MLSTPILFLIFNRPDTTKQTFEAIRRQKPKYLYIAADGPRPGNAEDIELCQATRNVLSQIDWDCQVKTLYQNKNLGCGVAPAQAITWFFQNVEQGIILEDDICTDPSFFTFCEIMLNYHKNDEKIMHISGSYFLDDWLKTHSSESYYFTKHIHVWGWATWRRAWKHYDYDMKDWPSSNSSARLKKYYGDYYFAWQDIFTRMQYKGNDIWDYQWMFAIYKQNGLAINPTHNLTKNIGFNQFATHTTDANSIYVKIKLDSLTKINHPDIMDVSIEKDILYYKHYLNFDLKVEMEKRKLSWKLKNNLKKLKRQFLAYFK